MQGPILASYVLKAQQQSARHQSEEEFLRDHQAADRAARRALASLAATVGGIAVFAAGVQFFA